MFFSPVGYPGCIIIFFFMEYHSNMYNTYRWYEKVRNQCISLRDMFYLHILTWMVIVAAYGAVNFDVQICFACGFGCCVG